MIQAFNVTPCHTKNQAHVFDDKSLNFAHVNIVTLPGKIDQVHYLLDNHSIDIMGFAETRLDESIPDNDVDIENYTLAEFRSVVKDTKSNTKNFTKSISIHSDYQSVHFW